MALSWVSLLIIMAIVVVSFFIGMMIKGSKDIANVEKYGGLKVKYWELIEKIVSRNSYYKIEEVNSNQVLLHCTGVGFRLIEMDKKLQVVWNWNRMDKVLKKTWYFDEFESRDKMYKTIDKDITIIFFMEDGLTQSQAEDFFLISKCTDEVEKKRLLDEFTMKYPDLKDNY